MRRHQVQCLAALLLPPALLGGCAGDDGPGGAPSGPLSVGDVSGGFAFAVPSQRPARWWASQGGFALCTTGAPAEIRRVRADVQAGAALRVEGWVVSDVPRDSPVGSFGSAVGRPPFIDVPYAPQGASTFEGSYQRAGGFRVDDPCPASSLKEGGTELVLAVRTDRRGVDLPGFTIDYASEGEAHSLDVDWATILCGTEARRSCDGL